MRWDIKVTWQWFLAAACLTACAVVATDYLKISLIAQRYIFWITLVGSICFAASGFAGAKRGGIPKSNRRSSSRMLSLICAIICAIGFFYFTNDYFLIDKSAQNSTEELNSSITVHNLFRDDFTTGSYKMIQGFSTDLYSDGKNIGEYEFEIGMYGDFQAKSLFLSIYVPGSDHATELLEWFSNSYKDYIYDAQKNIHIWTSSNDAQNQYLSDDLHFTNRIYIYYENILSNRQIQKIRDTYVQKGLDPEFRGFNYQENRKKYGPPLSQNFKEVDFHQLAEKPEGASETGPMHDFTPDPENLVQPSLLTLFMTDDKPEHGSAGVASYPVSIQTTPKSPTRVYNTFYRIVNDRSTKTTVFVIYVPQSIFTANIVLKIIENAKSLISEGQKQIYNSIDARDDLENYKFTGKVLIYTETPIKIPSTIDVLNNFLNQNGMSGEFRSTDHLMAIKHNIEIGKTPMPPIYKIKDDLPRVAEDEEKK